MRRYLLVIFNSVSVYAASSVYVFGVLAMVLIATGDIMLIFGIFAFGIITIIIALIALFRETARVRAVAESVHAETEQVHVLVNSQHDAMVDRINQLIAALHASGVHVPQARSREGARNG